MSSLDVQALFEILSRRRRLLERLGEGATDKRTLVETLSVSRSTVNRSLRRLENLGLVGYRDGAYETTGTGRLALDLFEETAATLDGLFTAQSLVERADAPFDPPVSLFRDATVVTVAEGRHSPVRALIDRLVAADEIRTLGSPFRTDLPTPVREHLFADDGTVELRAVLDEQSVEWLRTYHAPELETVLGAATHELRLSSEATPLTCLLSDSDPTAATVVFYDDTDTPRGLITSTDPRGVAWAERRFEEAWRASSPLRRADGEAGVELPPSSGR